MRQDEWPQYEGMFRTSEKAYQLLMIFGSLSSLLATIGVLLEMLAEHRSGRATSVTRVISFGMIGLSLTNFGRIWGTLPMPQIYQEYHTMGMPRGNTVTCTIQGFLLYFGSMVSLSWDTVLSITYVLMMCYNWSPAHLWRMEKVAHLLVWLLCLGPAVGALVTENYNQDEQFCFAVAEPEDCDAVDIPCLRGDSSGIYLIILQFVLLVAILASAVAMFMLYRAVRRLEDRNMRYASNVTASSPLDSSSPPQQNSAQAHKRSRRVGVQGILYTGSLFVTTTPLMTVTLVWEFAGLWNVHVYGIANFLSSLNGVCYFGVFQRQRSEMKTWYGRQLRRVLIVFSCCCFSECPLLRKGDSEAPTTSATGNAKVESMERDGTHQSIVQKSEQTFQLKQSQQNDAGVISSDV